MATQTATNEAIMSMGNGQLEAKAERGSLWNSNFFEDLIFSISTA
jgi:hypothetical protein